MKSRKSSLFLQSKTEQKIRHFTQNMLTFISCAKTMTSESSLKTPQISTPQYTEQALRNAHEMRQYKVEDLMKMLKVNRTLAEENYQRYAHFRLDSTSAIPSIMAYTGIVFKTIHPQDFTEKDFLYAQEHLRITSFLYGLLKPLDGIQNYRLEGNVKLPLHEGKTMFESWRQILTEDFIQDIKAKGGLLVNLASSEMKQLFFWKQVANEVDVITPEFRVRKNGQLKNIVVYTKMCRGAMTRFILKERIEKKEDLQKFTWEGFQYAPEYSKDGEMWFILEE